MSAKPAIQETNRTEPELLLLIERLHREVHPGATHLVEINLDSSFDRDLGLDSLTRVELLARLEKAFRITLRDEIFASAETPRDLLRALQIPAEKASTNRVQIPSSPLAEANATPTIPGNASTLIQVLKLHATQSPNRLHIRLYSDDDDGETITYGELWQEAAIIAAGLQSLTLAKGESVMLMLPTGRHYFVSFFGVLLAGGVPVPAYPPGRIKQIEEHLIRHAAIAANSRAKILITMPEAKPFAKIMHQQVATLGQVVTYAEVLEAGRNRPPLLPAVSGKDTAFLQYTSGSTGLPKGVILSHKNLLANIRAMGRTIEISSDDVFVSWLPLYHDMGLIGAWLGSLYFGCPLTVMSPLTFLANPLRWLTAISRYHGTLAAAPNFAYELCTRRIEQPDLSTLDLSSWRCAFNGAEAVNPGTIGRFTERFAPTGFQAQAMMPVYGLAESSVGLAFPPHRRPPLIESIDRQTLMHSGQAIPVPPDHPHALQLPSCGIPLPGHQIRVVDGGGRELPDRFEGFLQFAGPSATSGYFRNPEQTAELFQDTWLRSGDKGYIANGELFITGRSKDIIIKAGRNIYPVEIEEAISALEGIRQGNVAVFGSIDPENGTEKLVVLAETRKRKEADLSRLRIIINGVVADITGSAPDEVVLAPPNSVLKTSSGKIRRNATRELYERGEIGKPRRPLWLQLASFLASSTRPQLRRLAGRLKAITYASYGWLLLGLTVPLLWLLAVTIPGPRLRRSIVRAAARSVLRLAGIKTTIQGLDQLPAPETPCILVVNHASYLDAIVLGAFLPLPFIFIAKGELGRNPLTSLPLKQLGTVFVERFEHQQGVSDAASILQLAKRGKAILFFAEGTFMRMPGLLPFRMGAFETAIKGQMPIVPIALRGTRSILRADSWFPRRGKIRIAIGNTIKPVGTLEPDEQWGAAITLRKRVRTWMLEHTGEPDLEYEKPEPLLKKERLR
ncbi:MAG: AMP-binding protein [Proteobacteria bacterium]|nr:AMP-binding protein [Pseudomonadota bacterium]MBU1686764.1 AMP-binding protein [Pseudomonadota bacterium]